MRTRTWLAAIALAAIGGAAEPKVDKAAVGEVRRMGEYLAGLDSFRVHLSAADQKVTTDGQKLQFVSDGSVEIRRPDRLRSDRETPEGLVTYRYDGRNLAVSGPGPHYAIAPAPSTIDATVDIARQQYGIEAPAADLVLSRSADALLEGVESGQTLGVELVDGVPCEHLAFRGRDTDWQIWIQTGAQPLPRRMVITTKDVEGHPEFAVNLTKWELEPKIGDDAFRFKPPAGAERVPFLPPAQ